MFWRCGIALAAILATAVSAEPASAQQQKINICASSKDDDARIKACSDLIKRGGRYVESYYYNRSIAYQNKGECDRAYADAEKALSLKRDGYNLGQFAVLLLDCRNDSDRAITHYTEALRILPKEVNFYIGRGKAYGGKADFERALQDYNQAIRLNPRDADTYFQRGVLWWQQEDFDKAIAEYDQAIKFKPSMAAAHSYRGLAYSRKGDEKRALADLDHALSLEPNNADFYDNRASFYNKVEDYERALADHDKAIALSPISTHFLGRSKTWRAKGDLGRALADADEAVRIEIGTRWSRLHRGIIHRYRGEYDRAIADFDELLRQSPYDAETYVERGRAFEKKGDLVRARADFERALKERGTNFKTAHDDARAQLAALDAGRAAPVANGVPSAAISSGAVALSSPVAPILARDQGRRVALVIGNGEYAHSPKLANPARDAKAVANSLRAVGFQSVTVASDLSREGLIGALRTFSREAEKADWVMVYYAGHGIEVGGVNYLIPVDAKLESDRDASFEAVSLDQVLTAVDGAKKIKLVILDACRDNPFAAQMRRTVATRSIGRGLGRIEPEGATLVVYAAKHGQTALDGDAANSPFAAALVKRMATPDVEINKIFRLVRDDVLDTTGGRQEPFTYGSLPGREDFYFVAR